MGKHALRSLSLSYQKKDSQVICGQQYINLIQSYRLSIGYHMWIRIWYDPLANPSFGMTPIIYIVICGGSRVKFYSSKDLKVRFAMTQLTMSSAQSLHMFHCLLTATCFCFHGNVNPAEARTRQIKSSSYQQR